MIVLTQRDLIKSVLANWTRDYPPDYCAPGTFQGIALAQLQQLDLETCTAEDVDKIVGNRMRTTYQCHECLENHPEIVVVGANESDEGPWNENTRTFKICKLCLEKAFSLLS